MAEFNVDFLPLDVPFTDNKGMLTPAAEQYMRSLHNLVSSNFNANGTHLPTIEGQALVKTPTGGLENGASYYNTDSDQPETIKNGKRHSFNLTLIP